MHPRRSRKFAASCLGPELAGAIDRRLRVVQRPPGAGRRSEIVDEAQSQPLGTGPSDHCSIVGTEFRWRNDQSEAMIRCRRFENSFQPGIGGNASSHNEGRDGHIRASVAEQRHSDLQPIGNRFGYGILEGRTNVGNVLVGEAAQSVHRLTHRRLEAGKRKVAVFPPFQRPGEIEPPRIAVAGADFHLRSAGITQPQKLRHLVESLTQGIVNRCAETVIAADAFDKLELRMTARDQQQQVREFNRSQQSRRQRMAFEMIDRQQWLAVGQSDGLGHGETNDDAAQQTRSGSRGNAIEFRKPQARLRHGLSHQAIEVIDMGARRNFRDNAAIGRMIFQLRQHDVGEDQRAAVRPPSHHCGSRLVTRGFDTENVGLDLIHGTGDGTGV